MKKNSIVICGGHLSPALALIEKILEKKKYKLFYLGRKNSIEKDNSLSLEYLTITKLKIPFYSITTGKFHRELIWRSPLSLIKIPIGIAQSIYYLVKIRPRIVISFGGYLALPICFSAWLLKIPIIVHEQTRVLGLSNRIVSRFARKICLSWEDTKNIPKGIEAVVTGLPIRESIFSKKSNKYCFFGNRKLPLLLVIGGSMGSRSINSLMAKIIPQLVVKFRIVHQCGSINDGADFKKLLKIKYSLPKSNKKNYFLIKHINPFDIGSLFNCCDLIISRAGANTVAELAALKKKAIFIPLPWAADQEQMINAKYLVDKGYAAVLDQTNLDSDFLLKIILKTFHKNIPISDKKSRIDSVFNKRAAERLVKIIDSVIENKF